MDREQMRAAGHHWLLCRVAAAVVGIGLIALGVVAIAGSGLARPLDEPVVLVVGLEHNAMLGIIELIAGVLLGAAAVSGSPGAVSLVSILIGVSALLVLIEPSVAHDALPITRAPAAIVLVAAATVALTAEFAAPRGARSARWTKY